MPAAVGNVSDIIVVPPQEGQIEINATQPSFNETLEVTPPIFFPDENQTGQPTPVPPPVDGAGLRPEQLPVLPDEAIDNVGNASEDLEQAIDNGSEAGILKAMQEAISAQQQVVSVVETATPEQREEAKDKVEVLTDLIDQAFSEVSPN